VGALTERFPRGMAVAIQRRGWHGGEYGPRSVHSGCAVSVKVDGGDVEFKNDVRSMNQIARKPGASRHESRKGARRVIRNFSSAPNNYRGADLGDHIITSECFFFSQEPKTALQPRQDFGMFNSGRSTSINVVYCGIQARPRNERLLPLLRTLRSRRRNPR